MKQFKTLAEVMQYRNERTEKHNTCLSWIEERPDGFYVFVYSYDKI